MHRVSADLSLSISKETRKRQIFEAYDLTYRTLSNLQSVIITIDYLCFVRRSE